MYKRPATYGFVVGTPTVHHVTAMGNTAKQFILHLSSGDYEVLVTAGNSSLGYSIGNSEMRDYEHRFTFDARGKVTGATRTN